MTANVPPLTEEQKLHETTTHVISMRDDGRIVWTNKVTQRTDSAIPSLEALLLLDIAQSLLDIRLWGLSQNSEGGQRTYRAY